MGVGALRARETHAAPPPPARPAHLSFVTVPRMATVHVAGAAELMAATGPGEPATVAGAGLALLGAGLAARAASAGTATAGAKVASAGVGEVGSDSVSALYGKRRLQRPGPPPG